MLVDQAGATMQQVVERVKRVSDIVSEITMASDEQRAGIEQVHMAIAQMDQTTQQNAALVEQAAAAAASMQDQAMKLSQAVSVFRVDGTAASALRPAVRLPSPAQHQHPALPLRSPAKQAQRRTAPVGSEWEEF